MARYLILLNSTCHHILFDAVYILTSQKVFEDEYSTSNINYEPTLTDLARRRVDQDLPMACFDGQTY